MKRTSRYCRLAILTASLWATAAAPAGWAGQFPPTPERLVEEYVRSVSEGDWERLAELVDPELLSGLKSTFIAAVEKCKAEEEVKRDTGLELSEMMAMSGRELLALMLKSVPEGGTPSVSSSHVEIIGVLKEDDLRHVVYRFKTDEHTIEFTKVNVLTARPVPGGWAINLLDDVQGGLVGLQLHLKKC